jgi:hypothetical protein
MNRREAIAGVVAFGLCGRAAIGGARGATTLAPWPDRSNTGVPPGVKLTASKSLAVATAGAVIDALDVDGPVNIEADNVLLRRCRVRSASAAVIKIKTGASGVIVEDCDIDGVGRDNDGCNGIQGSGVFRRNNIRHVENGVTPDGGGPTIIEDNYIHDLLASGSPHYDCIQIDGGVENIVIRHNTVINAYPQTSAIMIDNYFGEIKDIIVENNLLIGGGYTIYVDARFNSSAVSNVRISNNHMGAGKWGVTSFSKHTPLYEGNTDDGFEQLKLLRGI